MSVVGVDVRFSMAALIDKVFFRIPTIAGGSNKRWPKIQSIPCAARNFPSSGAVTKLHAGFGSVQCQNSAFNGRFLFIAKRSIGRKNRRASSENHAKSPNVLTRKKRRVI
jgi:hypothetical protein